MTLAGHLGGENGRDLIENIAARHPSERIRFAAWKAAANGAGSPEEREKVFERAATATGGLVRAMAEREAARIRSARRFYEQAPMPGMATSP